MTKPKRKNIDKPIEYMRRRIDNNLNVFDDIRSLIDDLIYENPLPEDLAFDLERVAGEVEALLTKWETHHNAQLKILGDWADD